MAKATTFREPLTPKADPPARESATRLSITLDDAGKIAWDRIRPGTQDQLRKLVTDDARLRPAIGGDVSTGPTTIPIPPAALGAVIDVWAQVTVLLVMRWQGCTRDQAAEAMEYSETEKTLVADPLARVLAKYAPTTLTRYQDEITLALIVMTTTTTKLAALQQIMARDAQHVSAPEVKTEMR